MITSKKVKQFIQEKCGAEVVGIAPATPFSEEDKKRVTDTLKIIGEANPAMSNCALGNSGDEKALPCLEIAARDEDPLLRSHAEWAIEEIRGIG